MDMKDNQLSVLNNLTNTRNILRKKLKQLKLGEMERVDLLKETFTPISQPLNTLVQKLDKRKDYDEDDDHYDDNANKRVDEKCLKRKMIEEQDYGDEERAVNTAKVPRRSDRNKEASKSHPLYQNIELLQKNSGYPLTFRLGPKWTKNWNRMIRCLMMHA